MSRPATATQEGSDEDAAALRRLQQRREHGERYAKANAALVRAEWRQKLRVLKTQELKRSLGVTEELYHGQISRQETLLQTTIHDFRAVEEMVQQASARHAGDMHALRNLQHTRMAAMQQQFERQLADMAAEFSEETAAHRQAHERHRAAVAEPMAALDLHKAAVGRAAEAALAARKEAIVNADIEDQAVLRMPFDERKAELQALRDHMKQEHHSNTAALAESFQQLSLTASSQDAALQQSRVMISQLEAELAQWRSKLAASSREWTARNRGLRAETHAVRRHCAALRCGMARCQADHAFALRQLCVESNAKKQQLQQQLAIVQRVLKMAVLSSNLAHQQILQPATAVVEDDPLVPAAAAQPGYDCGLPDEAGAMSSLAAIQHTAAPVGLRSQLLEAVLQQLNNALERGKTLRCQAAELKSQVAARQLGLLQERSFNNDAVIGISCLALPKADLLQLD